MLHWQPLKWLNQLPFTAKIILGSVIGHIVALFFLFVVYKDSCSYHILITGTMIDTDVPIVFMPLHKSLQQSQGSEMPSRSSVGIAAPEQTAVTKTASVKKREKVTTLGQPAKSCKKVKQKKKQPAKKTEPTPFGSMEACVSKPNGDLSTRAEPVLSKVEGRSIEANEPLTESVLYVGQQEMEALQMQEYIQQEMAQHWSPPPGMRKDICCTVKVVVGFDGTLGAITFDKPSGVLLFDGAARRAAAQLQPPRWAYGKEFLITFTP